MCLLLPCCVPLLYALMCLNVYIGASWCARPSDVGFMQAGSHCICHLEVCNNNTLYLPPPQIAVSSSADISIRPAPPLTYSSLGFSSFSFLSSNLFIPRPFLLLIHILILLSAQRSSSSIPPHFLLSSAFAFCSRIYPSPRLPNSQISTDNTRVFKIGH